MHDLRPLRVGTHRSGNIYFADTPPGSPGGQLGYLNDDAYAEAMVAAFNASLVRDNGLARALYADADRVEALGGDYNVAVAVGVRAAARMVEHPETIPGGTDG